MSSARSLARTFEGRDLQGLLLELTNGNPGGCCAFLGYILPFSHRDLKKIVKIVTLKSTVKEAGRAQAE